MIETENTETNGAGPGLGRLVQRLAVTGLGALHNRAELLSVELEEEKGRLLEMVLAGVGLLFLVMMGLVMLTGTIVYLFPEGYRIYAFAGFTILYLGGAVGAFLKLKRVLKEKPFAETLRQVQKDAEWLESFKINERL
jgi:uncharacterized membrane protein YqjE